MLLPRESIFALGAIVAAEKRVIFGSCDNTRICTSHTESFNQNFRTHLKRFAPLTAIAILSPTTKPYRPFFASTTSAPNVRQFS
jgi:hypothetical protein